MRIHFGLWLVAALIGAGGLSAADSPEQVLARAKEEVLRGHVQAANDSLAAFLKKTNVDAAAGEEMVREQIRWGSLPEAAQTAEVLLARAELLGASPALKRLLAEVMTLHDRELDRVLALKDPSSVRLTSDALASELPKLLRRTALVNVAKADQVVRHLFSLLRELPLRDGASAADHVSAQFLVNLGQVPGLMGTVLELADTAGLTPLEDWYGRYVFEITQESALCRPGHLVAVFTGPAFGGEVDRFRDLPLSRQGDAPTLLAKFVALLGRSGSAELRWEVVQALEELPRDTFGTGLTRLLLDDDQGVTELQAYLKRHEQDLTMLNDQAAGNLLTLLGTRFEEAGKSGAVAPELRPFLRPLLEAEAWHLETARLAWRNAKHLSELKFQPEEAPPVVEAVLRRLVLHGSPETEGLLADAVRLLSDGAGQDGRKRAGKLLQEMAAVPELTAEVLQLAKREGFHQDEWWRAEALRKAWQPGVYGKQPDKLLKVLEAAGLLGAAGDFTGGFCSTPDRSEDFVRVVLGSLEHRPEVRNPLLAALEKRPVRTFGVAALGALLKPGSDKGMTAVGVEFREELSALPADQRSLMAAFFARWVGSDLAAARAVPGFATELNLTLTERSLKVGAEADRILSLNSVEDLHPGAKAEMARTWQGTEAPTAPMKELAATLAEALAMDAGTAAEAFGKVSTMIHAKDRQQAQQMPDKRIRLFGVWLLAALDHRELHPLVQKELGKIVLQRMDYFWVERAEKQLVPVEDFKQAATAVARMERLGLLVPAAEFRPLNLARHCSMPETLARRIEEMPAAVRGEAARLLLDRKPPVFGASLMAALLQPGWQEAEQVLKDVRVELGRLSAGDVQLVFRGFAKLFPAIQEAGTVLPEGGVLAFMGKVNAEAEARVLKPQAGAPAPGAVASAESEKTWLGADATAREFQRLLQNGDDDGARQLFNRTVLKQGDRITLPPEEALIFYRHHVPGFGNWREERLMGLFRRTPPLTLAGLLLGGAAMDTSGQLGLPGHTLALEVALSMEQGWQNAGGQAVPEKAVLPFLNTFATGLGQAPAVSAAPAFARFLKTLPRSTRLVMLQGAAAVPAGDKLYAVARELAMTGVLMEGKTSSPLTPAAAWDHYTALMTGTGLNPRVRLDLAVHLCTGHPREVPPAIVLEGARLAVESWIRRDWNDDGAMVALFDCFLQLPESDAWNGTAGAFVAEWKSLIKAAMTAKIRRGNHRVERVVLGMLSRLGDQEGIDMHLKYFGGTVTEDRWRVAVLARNGQFQRAADLVRKRWPAFTGNHAEWLETATGPPLPDYTRVAALSGVFKEGEHDLALIAEYAMLYDARPQPGGDATLTLAPAPADEAWAGRIRDLASKVAKSPVTNREARKALHGLLVSVHPETLLELTDGIVQDLAVTGWRTGGFRPYNQEAWPVKLLGMQAAVQVVDGDLSYVRQRARQIGRLIQLEQASEPARRTEARGAFYWQALEGVAANAARVDFRQRAEFMKLLERELAGLGSQPVGTGEMLMLRWVVDCWVRAGVPAGKSTVVTTREIGGAEVGEDEMRKGLQVLGRLAQGAPPAFRQRLMLAVAETPLAFELLGRHWVNARQMLLPCGLLTPAELVACGPEVVRAVRGSSKTAHELAMLADELGMGTEILALADAGLAAPRPEPGDGEQIPDFIGHLDGYERAALWRSLLLRKASVLIRLKQGDAAKQVLAQLGDTPRDEARAVLEQLASGNP